MNTNECAVEKIYLYTRFERFWHWVQGGFVVMLGLTGFEIHAGYPLFGFKKAVEWHNTLGISWLILYAFIVFWHLTTGQWKHYVPTTKMLLRVILYYMIGIFKGEPHPVPKSERVKHNPLQRLTYLGISVVVDFGERQYGDLDGDNIVDANETADPTGKRFSFPFR